MRKIVSKLHGPHVLQTSPAQHKKEEEDPTESTGVVPAKYPPKAKLENFHNSRVSELE